MKKYIFIILSLYSIAAFQHPAKNGTYRVESKDSANVSMMIPELQPKETMIIKVNNETLWKGIGKDSTGNPGFWKYYRYPGKVQKIELLDYYKNKLKVSKVFTDTLVDVRQRTLIVSRPFPKGMTDAARRKHGFVSIDTGDRLIKLVDDAVEFKGSWTD